MTQSWRNGVRKKRKTEDTKHQQTMMDAPSPPGAQKLPSSEDRSRNADIPAANADQASLMENAQITTATDFAIIENGSTEAVGASSSSSRQLLYRSPEFSELSGCGCVAAVAILIRKLPISPNQRGFPVQYLENSDEYVLNQSYNEPLVGDTVSNATFIIVGIVLPFVVQFIFCYATSKQRTLDLHNTACVYMLTFGITILTTDIIKVYAGYLRPVFFEYCKPDENYQECTSDAAKEENYRMSFPSGHASGSFCGLTLLTLYLHTHFGVATKRVYKQQVVVIDNDGGNVPTHRLVAEFQQPLGYTRLISILALLPMALAIFIAASRVHDNKHFPADVVGGSLLGASVAVYVNSLWFP